MFNLGMGEIIVILAIALIVLGPSQLPKMATSIGKAMREFRKATLDIREEIDKDDAIARPLRELRDAMTLPPAELKRQDEWRKAEEERQRLLVATPGTVAAGSLTPVVVPLDDPAAPAVASAAAAVEQPATAPEPASPVGSEKPASIT